VDKHEIRDGIAAIDELVRSSADGDGTLGINASNLIYFYTGSISRLFVQRCSGHYFQSGLDGTSIRCSQPHP